MPYPKYKYIEWRGIEGFEEQINICAEGGYRVAEFLAVPDSKKDQFCYMVIMEVKES